MNRGASLTMVVIGTAWALAGLGAITGHLDASDQHADMLAEAKEQAAKQGDEIIESAKESLEEATKAADEELAEARERLAAKQKRVDEVNARFDEMVGAKEEAREEAEEDGNERKIKRAEAALARVERKRAGQLKRPTATRDGAKELVDEMSNARAEVIAEGKKAIADAEKAKTEAITEAEKDMVSLKPHTNIWGPSLALVLGLCLVGAGIVFLGSGRGTEYVLQGRPRNTMMKADGKKASPDPDPTVDVASSPAMETHTVDDNDDGSNTLAEITSTDDLPGPALEMSGSQTTSPQPPGPPS